MKSANRNSKKFHLFVKGKSTEDQFHRISNESLQFWVNFLTINHRMKQHFEIKPKVSLLIKLKKVVLLHHDSC